MIIFQRPNALIIVALALTLLGYVPVGGIIHKLIAALGVSAWCAWGYDELRYGVNWFRRGLGLVVLAWQVMGLLR